MDSNLLSPEISLRRDGLAREKNGGEIDFFENFTPPTEGILCPERTKRAEKHLVWK